MEKLDYAGFWLRTAAAIIDTLLVLIIILPLLILIYGQEYLQGTALIYGFWDIFLNYILPAIVIVIFWIYKSATPGKMILKMKIVDAESGDKPSTAQLIGRYFAYYISVLPFMLGIIWVAFDARKQGWHDKLAGTVVVRQTGGRIAATDE